MLFKDKLLEIRKKQKLSQEKLALLLGCKQSLISAWERGYYEPNIMKLKRIATALQCTVSELVGDTETFKKEKGKSNDEM